MVSRKLSKFKNSIDRCYDNSQLLKIWKLLHIQSHPYFNCIPTFRQLKLTIGLHLQVSLVLSLFSAFSSVLQQTQHFYRFSFPISSQKLPCCDIYHVETVTTFSHSTSLPIVLDGILLCEQNQHLPKCQEIFVWSFFLFGKF